jgi:hypothetical protein
MVTPRFVCPQHESCIALRFWSLQFWRVSQIFFFLENLRTPAVRTTGLVHTNSYFQKSQYIRVRQNIMPHSLALLCYNLHINKRANYWQGHNLEATIRFPSVLKKNLRTSFWRKFNLRRKTYLSADLTTSIASALRGVFNQFHNLHFYEGITNILRGVWCTRPSL